MPLYHVAFFLLVVGVIIEFWRKKTSQRVYYAAFLLLTVMLCFRYGQGADYFSYGVIYERIGQEGISAFTNPTIHGEVGWKLLCYCMWLIDVPYAGFVFAVSAVEMAMLWIFIKRYCKYQCLALLLSYHTLYLTYFFSALRQGLVIALFLGTMLELLIQRKWKMYCIFAVVCASIHSSGLLLLIAPFLHLGLFKSLRNHIKIVALVWSVGLVIATGIVDSFLDEILPYSLSYYFLESSVSIAALERIVTYTIVAYIYWLHNKKESEMPKHASILMCVVTLGMIVYGGLIWTPMVASRLAVVFKMAEIGLLCSLLAQEKVCRKLTTLFCAILATFMYVKNIISYIDQGAYYKHVNFLNYPYVSILDLDAIEEFRDTSYGGVTE